MIDITYNRNHLNIIYNNNIIIKQYMMSDSIIFTYIYIIHFLLKLGLLNIKL